MRPTHITYEAHTHSKWGPYTLIQQEISRAGQDSRSRIHRCSVIHGYTVLQVNCLNIYLQVFYSVIMKRRWHTHTHSWSSLMQYRINVFMIDWPFLSTLLHPSIFQPNPAVKNRVTATWWSTNLQVKYENQVQIST